MISHGLYPSAKVELYQESLRKAIENNNITRPLSRAVDVLDDDDTDADASSLSLPPEEVE